jgi:hypothetical protein
MKIIEITPHPNWTLTIVSDDGRKGNFDVSPYLDLETFTLGLRATRIISGLNTFTCVVADFLLRSGFMQSVTVLHAEFSTELVANLYSGWIVQLVDASLTWRTHKVLPC